MKPNLKRKFSHCNSAIVNFSMVRTSETTWSLPGVVHLCLSANPLVKPNLQQTIGLASKSKHRKEDLQYSTSTFEQTSKRTDNVGVKPIATPPTISVDAKREIIKNHLLILLHAVLCRVKDALKTSAGTTTEPCIFPFCEKMKCILRHVLTCRLSQHCPHQDCFNTRHVLFHWKSCKSPLCQVCRNVIKPVNQEFLKLTEYPPWKKEIMSRYQWLPKFVGPPFPEHLEKNNVSAPKVTVISAAVCMEP